MSKRTKKYPETLCVLGGALELRSLPLCPELRLWLLHEGVDLNARVSELFQSISAPYWAFCWGAGQALARYLLDNPELVRGQRVVDFGAGSGVAGIAASLAGAKHVTAVDIDPIALRIAECNAEENGVELAVSTAVPEPWDVLLASDVLYETGNEHWLQTAAASGREVLLSDPLRHGTPRQGLVRHDHSFRDASLVPDFHSARVLLERGATIPSSPTGPVKTGPCAIRHERSDHAVLEVIAEYAVRTLPDVDYPIGRALIHRLAPNS